MLEDKWFQEQSRIRFCLSSKYSRQYCHTIGTNGSQSSRCNRTQTVKSCLRDYLNLCLIRVCQQSDLDEIRPTVEHEPVQTVKLVFCCVPKVSPFILLLSCIKHDVCLFLTCRTGCHTGLFVHTITVFILFCLLAPEQLLLCWLTGFFFPPVWPEKPLVNGVTSCQPYLCSSLKFCWLLN